MARQLLTMDGRYDRAAIVRRANAELRRARELGLGWDRAKCLSYVWRQARVLHAQFHNHELNSVPVRRKPILRAPQRRRREHGRVQA